MTLQGAGCFDEESVRPSLSQGLAMTKNAIVVPANGYCQAINTTLRSTRYVARVACQKIRLHPKKIFLNLFDVWLWSDYIAFPRVFSIEMVDFGE